MGSQGSIEECTSTDNPRVRDCCHLEGETPIEIRIAYQHPRPSAQPAGIDPAALRAHQAGGFAPYRRGGPSSGPWPPSSADAEKPPMPRGADRLRLPPPSGSARPLTRTAAASQSGGGADDGSGGDFDADTFAVPPDSERSEVSATPGRMAQPVALQVLQLAVEDGHFPEIVRANRQPHTFREAPAAHHEGDDTPGAARRNGGAGGGAGAVRAQGAGAMAGGGGGPSAALAAAATSGEAPARPEEPSEDEAV